MLRILHSVDIGLARKLKINTAAAATTSSSEEEFQPD
jgi:hypothetical protein